MNHAGMTCEQIDRYFDRKFKVQARHIIVLKNYILNIKLNAEDKQEVEDLCDEVLTNSQHYQDQLIKESLINREKMTRELYCDLCQISVLINRTEFRCPECNQLMTVVVKSALTGEVIKSSREKWVG